MPLMQVPLCTVSSGVEMQWEFAIDAEIVAHGRHSVVCRNMLQLLVPNPNLAKPGRNACAGRCAFQLVSQVSWQNAKCYPSIAEFGPRVCVFLNGVETQDLQGPSQVCVKLAKAQRLKCKIIGPAADPRKSWRRSLPCQRPADWESPSTQGPTCVSCISWSGARKLT